MFDTKRIWFLGALLLGAMAPAQEKQTEQPPPRQESAAKQDYDKLVKDFGAAQQEYYAQRRKEAEAAKADGKPAPAMNMAGPAAEWLPRFKAGAEQYKGTDGAVPFLIWVGNNVRGEERNAVLNTLLTDHIKSPALSGALRLIGSTVSSAGMTVAPLGTAAGNAPAKVDPAKRDADRKAAETLAREMFAKVIQQNPSPDVQAQALLARANLVLEARGEIADEAKKLAIADGR